MEEERECLKDTQKKQKVKGKGDFFVARFQWKMSEKMQLCHPRPWGWALASHDVGKSALRQLEQSIQEVR